MKTEPSEKGNPHLAARRAQKAALLPRAAELAAEGRSYQEIADRAGHRQVDRLPVAPRAAAGPGRRQGPGHPADDRQAGRPLRVAVPAGPAGVEPLPGRSADANRRDDRAGRRQPDDQDHGPHGAADRQCRLPGQGPGGD